MLDFTWKVFCMTGDVNTYLLYKEIEQNETTDHLDEEEKPLEDQTTL